MGMFSEIHAQNTAKDLQRVLLRAIALDNKDVQKYAQSNILPLYEDAVEESYSSEIENSDAHGRIKIFFDHF